MVGTVNRMLKEVCPHATNSTNRSFANGTLCDLRCDAGYEFLGPDAGRAVFECAPEIATSRMCSSGEYEL